MFTYEYNASKSINDRIKKSTISKRPHVLAYYKQRRLANQDSSFAGPDAKNCLGWATGTNISI